MTKSSKIRDRMRIDDSLLPDGGWGWMVVLGVALTNMFNQSLVSVYGLLFGELLEHMGHGTAGVALVANINNMVTCFSGLFMGPVLKTYSCRKVSFCGAIITAAGMMMSSFAETITELIIYYSILTGIGLGLMYPSTFVAIKSYFTEKRGRAVGLSMAGTGVGQMLMPQIVRFLLDGYGYRWTTRIIGALCLHGAAGALLFQPVWWHLKVAPRISKTEQQLLSSDNIELAIEEKPEVQCEKTEFKSSVELESNEPSKGNSNSHVELSIWQKISELFDLNLVKDPVFVNIAIGLGLAYTAGMTFAMIFPFFLLEGVGLTRADTALCMSLLSAADIVARLTLPTMTHFLNISNRTTFLYGAFALAVARSVIAEQTTRTAMIIASIFCGYIRAATVINQNLTCSDYCRDDQLPAALGLIMVSKGLFVMSIGQLLGWFRDYSTSFSLCIHATSVLLLIIFLSWGAEMVMARFRKAITR